MMRLSRRIKAKRNLSLLIGKTSIWNVVVVLTFLSQLQQQLLNPVVGFSSITPSSSSSSTSRNQQFTNSISTFRQQQSPFFVTRYNNRYRYKQRNFRLYATLPDIDSMRIGDIRAELESYGISTKSFLEKNELIEALTTARAEGKVPVNGSSTSTSSTSSSSTSSSSDTQKTSSTTSTENVYEQALEKAKNMKVTELKKLLQSMGVNVSSFFEKSEFVKAYADVIASGKSTSSESSTAAPEPPRDPSYRDVIMQKMDKRDPRLLQGTIIDIKV